MKDKTSSWIMRVQPVFPNSLPVDGKRERRSFFKPSFEFVPEKRNWKRRGVEERMASTHRTGTELCESRRSALRRSGSEPGCWRRENSQKQEKQTDVISWEAQMTEGRKAIAETHR